MTEKEFRQRVMSLHRLMYGMALRMGMPPDDAADAEYRDTRAAIERLIDSLPEGQRTAIRLSSFGGLDNNEIAATTGLSEANVRQLLSRGRRKLRELWNENY